MPKVSEFFGILIYFYYNDHPPPHFHARYAGVDAVFDIESLRLIQGSAQPRVRGLVVEWASRHQDDLRRAWHQARAGGPIDPIPPLD
jgi:hypothetical protein